FPDLGLHGAHQAVLFTSDFADLPRNTSPDRSAGIDPGEETERGGAPANLCVGGHNDPHRDLRDALERGNRWATVLKELPRLYDLQSRVCDARRIAAGALSDHPTLRYSLGTVETAPSMGGAQGGVNMRRTSWTFPQLLQSRISPNKR